MSPRLAELLAEPEGAGRLPVEEIPGLLTELVALLGAIVGRTLSQPAPAPKGEPDRLLTVKEVAARLAVPKSFVYELARRGDLASARLGRYVRFRVTAIEEYLSRQEQKPLDKRRYVTYLNTHDGTGSPKDSGTVRAIAIPVRRSGRRDAKHRGAVGAGRAWNQGVGRKAHADSGEEQQAKDETGKGAVEPWRV